MSLFIDTKSVQKAATEQCHYVPFETDFDGEARVLEFFNKTVTPKVNKESDMTASFRGRPFNGTEVDLPSGYTGLVFKEPHKRSTEDEDRTLVATCKFDRFTYWNLDKQTTSDDLVQRALQWVELSAALHQPVTAESSQDSSQRSMKGQ